MNISLISVLISKVGFHFCFYYTAPFCVPKFYKSILMAVCNDIVKISLFLRLIRYDFTTTQKRRSVLAKATWFFRLVRRFPVRRTCLKGRHAKGGLSRRDWESVPLVYLDSFVLNRKGESRILPIVIYAAKFCRLCQNIINFSIIKHIFLFKFLSCRTICNTNSNNLS